MFRFSMQPVLEQRLIEEEKRQREFSDVMIEVTRVKRHREAIASELERRNAQLRIRQARGLSFAERELSERWMTAQEAEMHQMDEQLTQLNAKLEEHRERLVRAMRNRMVLEKLREREYQAWRLAEGRQERRVFDEIAIREFARSARREKIAERPERNA